MTPEQEQRIFDVLNEQLKKFPNDVEVYCHRLERLVHGSVRRDTKKNKYLVQVGMNATELLTDECKGNQECCTLDEFQTYGCGCECHKKEGEEK